MNNTSSMLMIKRILFLGSAPTIKDHVRERKQRETETQDKILPSSEVGHGLGENPKKNRKEQSKNVHINEQNKQHTINEETMEEDGNKREDAKIGAAGIKVSIYLTEKLKEDGVIFESNADQAPLEFRLGKGKVIEDLDVKVKVKEMKEKRKSQGNVKKKTQTMPLKIGKLA
ncbi:peptidyl-prolyl cis-trans isomerase-like isoform X2 [Gastrolobium bilobum]|uniref:peptidyl-prolyl cis-trans isomerase-like isoform X2 n=1 Tax=Gastrolobium bilobum TaxID=150636 RepID=UPI002AAF9ED4|nr:peptidyl-prolyl cis-trans isomerase-like isoform X2 [Gastrolobium bilobum]